MTIQRSMIHLCVSLAITLAIVTGFVPALAKVKVKPTLTPPSASKAFFRCGFVPMGAKPDTFPRYLNLLLAKQLADTLPSDPIEAYDQEGLLFGNRFISFESKPVPGNLVRYLLSTGPAEDPKRTIMFLAGTGQKQFWNAGLGPANQTTRYVGDCTLIEGPAAEARFKFFLPPAGKP